MKKYKLHLVSSILLIFILCSFWSCNVDEVQTVTTLNRLVMQDEFNTDGAPSSEMWDYEIGTGIEGWGNKELQYYTDRPENVKVEGGMLHITARKEAYEGSKYTSARIITKDLVERRYGRFEARIKLPWGRGYWPAFWLLGANIDDVSWPQCGEIDIMEYVGQKPTEMHGSVHGPGYSGGQAMTKAYELQNDRFDTGFHVFGIEWGKDYINYYFDDVLFNQITPDDTDGGEWVFNQPFYILINVAVGGTFVGDPNDNTVFPQTMLVDYVRIYE
jgi:beta-glucanase (GH16 family)